jgi:hypothetical protein
MFPALSFAKLLPESRHQQYQTYALLLEDHSFLLLQSGHKSFNQIAGNIAFYEFEENRFKPQIIMSAVVNAAIRLDKNDMFTETADTYLNLISEFTIDETTRFSIGVRHQSGHVTEDVLNKELTPYNSGNELLTARFVKDLQNQFRVGGTLKPVLSSDPKMNFWGSDQFVEWFPQGFSNSSKSFAPYLAAGLEQSGVHELVLTKQLQAGFYVGNHHQPMHAPTLRFVVGFYQGVDTRLKYAQYKNSKATFGYAGMMVNF